MPAGIAVSVLGPFQVRSPSGPVDVRGSRLRTLCAVLALGAGREVSRAQLLEALWDEEPPAAPDNALQALVSRLRRSLPGVAVESGAGGYRLVLERAAVDAWCFEAFVQDAASARGEGGRRLDLLREGLGLWRGPALSGLIQSRTVRAHAARLGELRWRALEDRIEAELEAGGGASLVAELSGLVFEDPYREHTRALLMRALQAAGRQTDALAVYDDARKRLSQAFGIDPSAELQQTYLEVLRGQAVSPPTPAPPPAAAPVVAGGGRRRLPTPLTPLVGREADVCRVGELLDRARLVTVVGPGGVGKTRVAVASARRVEEAGDPVWMVELAAVGDPSHVPGTVLRATGIGEGGLLGAEFAQAPHELVMRRLTGLLGEGRGLLVLDNCEHLVGAVAQITAEVLAACPRLRVLAASRQPLGVHGERLHHLGGLPLPPRDGSLAEAAAAPAVRLFTDRATAVRPSFVLDGETAGPVVEICRSLDGLPLALELAAARLLSLSAQEIRSRLHDRFRLLEPQGGSGERRQRTLRTVTDWSWELLEQAEQTLARRLAVFAGRVELPLIERVCAGAPGAADPPVPGELEQLLSSLVAKSIVYTDQAEGRSGYRMPETVRLYAGERLTAAGEESALRQRHAETLLEIAQAAEPRLRRGEQTRELAALTLLWDDFHAALRWSLAKAPPELPLRLVASLEWFWLLSGRRTEGAEWTRRVLARTGGTRPVERAIVCVVGGLQQGALLGREEGVAYLFEALELVQRLPASQTAEHPVLVVAGVLGSLASGSPERVGEVLRRLAGHADPWLAALARMLRARMLANAGQPSAARGELLAALEGFRQVGERLGLAYTLSALAESDSALGDHVGAVSALREALQAVTELGDAQDAPMLLVRLATEHARVGAFRSCEGCLTDAEREATRLGLGEVLGVVHHARGDLRRAEGRLEEARGLLDRALAQVTRHGRGVGYRPAVLVSRGHLAVAEGRTQAAAEACAAAAQFARTVGEAGLRARVLVLAADMALGQDEPERAAALLRTACEVRGEAMETEPDVRRITAAARSALGAERYAATGPLTVAAAEALAASGGGLSRSPAPPPAR
ncbi:winged helix-turn-helix domain-containing protein [Streptomyces tubbatahanensis]|uniref:Winged helix-turn-helix domain-containing protein n=1 Tax=Streptomyces tubbatahanensis TaxID=2923272 RepID=A0ABY3Y2Q1_9ACTN|nr:BTAD domain-containing putative transcriptional regulator [Streptomyces tubbatahanensis]UNS95025.1 winged helix-turn-helix domain-containing protein [Streptomyces tubbatahanensis]UNT00803.1 winged helix-turn-helix domain-containing protein [Streptomyces tubbatahanensis]